ncbi:hypothetical protein QQ045_018257 [Rhodiola kirilowii]
MATDSHNRILLDPYTECEIKAALFQLYPFKAPGLDGFPAGFFQKFWNTIKWDFTEACLCILNGGDIPQGCNETLIVLIPKLNSVTRMEDYRPISLTSVISKTVAKVIVNRLQQILPGIISPSQSAFIKGRLITDNFLIAHEIAHFIKNTRNGKKGYGSLKLDMSKAYDRVEWRYLKMLLLRFGFEERWVNMIMNYVSSVRYVICINGKISSAIVPERGLRQEGWRAKNLSAGGKEILIKSVLQALPQYAMNCFLLPEDTIKKMHSSVERYWWSCSNNLCRLPYTASFADIIHYCWIHFTRRRRQLVLVTLWMMWYNRNKLKHGENGYSLNELVYIITNQSRSFEQNDSKFMSSMRFLFNSEFEWRILPAGFIKINCDAAMRDSRGGGIGIVARDSNGVILAVSSRKRADIHSSAICEGIGLLESFRLAENLRAEKVIFESDCAEAVRWLNICPYYRVAQEDWFKRSVHILHRHMDWKVVLIRREVNVVADLLAKRVMDLNWCWTRLDCCPRLSFLSS